MSIYKVEIVETLSDIFKIQAGSKNEAIELIRVKHENNDICIGHGEVSTEYNILED